MLSYSQEDHPLQIPCRLHGPGKSSQLGLYPLLPSWNLLSGSPTLYSLGTPGASGADNYRTSPMCVASFSMAHAPYIEEIAPLIQFIHSFALAGG